MNREDLLDHAVGKCEPIRNDAWGTCQTHGVGWAPAAFKTGRCWAIENQVKAIDVVLKVLHDEVETCIQDALEHYEASDHADWVTAVHAGRTAAFTDVLDLLSGKDDDA